MDPIFGQSDGGSAAFASFVSQRPKHCTNLAASVSHRRACEARGPAFAFRSDTPSSWLQRLPDEAYRYYQEGVSTFGSEAQTPVERRGRLYLIHTALLFMWMSWGKKTVRERFQSQPNEGTRRAASVVTLEQFRRAGVLAEYDMSHWFFQPVGEWDVTVISGAVDLAAVADEALRKQTTATCDVLTLSGPRAEGAIPPRESLSL